MKRNKNIKDTVDMLQLIDRHNRFYWLNALVKLKKLSKLEAGIILHMNII